MSAHSTECPDCEEPWDDCLCHEVGRGFCYHCGDKGWVVTCMDDLCHGAGWCMHGDGEQVCPECGNPSGDPNWDRPWWADHDEDPIAKDVQ